MDGTPQEPTLVERILELGTRAFNPAADATSRRDAQQALETFVAKTKTLALIPALNALINRDRVPPWLHAELMTILGRMPMRLNDGVRATMEFVFSVHPDSIVTREEAATVQKHGAFIAPEALKMASTLIASPAAGVPAETWFSAISPQLFRLLDGDEGPELAKVAGHIIGSGVLGRKEYGGIGTPGFNTFVHPMLSKLNPSLPSPELSGKNIELEESVVDLRNESILVSPDDLALALKRLHALIHAYGHPALARRLLRPVLLSLWALSSWISPTELCEKSYGSPARDLFKIFIRLHASTADTRGLIRALLFKGNRNAGKVTWKFHATTDSLICILKTREQEAARPLFDASTLAELDPKADAFVKILDEVSSADEISTLFLDLFKQWFASNEKKAVKQIVVTQKDDSDPLVQLLETKVLQALMEKAPQKLIGHPDQILDLVKEVLQDNESLTSEESPAGIGLSLLNLLVTSTGFQKSKIDESVMDSIIESLERISRTNSDLAMTARRLSYLLQHWSEIEAELQPLPTATQRETEDRKTYNIAMQYITAPDAPAPVRSEGLNMISKLIVSRSPILDIPAVLVLMSSMLEDGDDFVNLKTIKIFTQLANNHPSSTVQELLEHYVDAQEKLDVDTRLRFGEALVQVVERLRETFTEDLSKRTCETLLAIAGRRPKREKTEKRQEKDARLAEMKRKKEAKEWGGQAPDWEDDDKDLPPDEKARNEILASIVGGWESKRGSEDVRIRSSALSILGAGIETNVAGVGAELVTATVDLSMDVLTLEPEIEKGILRRSAVLAVMSFVRALDMAKEGRKRLGFDLTQQSQEKLTRVLQYIAQTDNDGLVQQHAKDVVESLAHWRIATLLPEPSVKEEEPAFTRLAGLVVDPTRGLTALGGQGPRPRIEEIE